MYKYGDFRYCVFSMKCTGLLYYVLGVSACRTGVIFLHILGEQGQKGGKHEAWVVREGKSTRKTTSVHIPLFKLFWRSNMNAATQLVTLHHVILECFSNTTWRSHHKNNLWGQIHWTEVSFTTKILPFVTTYHLPLPNFKNILLSKWHLIQNQPLLREIFKEPPLIPYKKGKSLRDTRESKTITRGHYN